MHIGDIQFHLGSQIQSYSNPVELVIAERVAEVAPALARIERAVAAGYHAAGFLAYEAAPAFDPAFVAHAPGNQPLLWFGLYRDVAELPALTENAEPYEVGSWAPLVSREDHARGVRAIREWIAQGDTYQVNYTFPLRAPFRGDTLGWFKDLCAAQRTPYSAFIDTGRFHVLSLSPELFFRLDDTRLETRPMKGTRRRGRGWEEDQRLGDELARSEKDRAENLMIVDLLRNDLGRVSRTGSVEVSDLFRVERYETVWQMTSRVAALSDASLPEIIAALFPCGSVTGAPKVRTMQIIRELEPFPRGVYCGAIGWWRPGRQASFSVAIRTVVVDQTASTAEYHVGGGIVWDSREEAEFEECRTKAAFLERPQSSFELLESLLYDRGYYLLEAHLERLGRSAQYFDFSLDLAAVRQLLLSQPWCAAGSVAAADPLKVRLLLSRDGSIRVSADPVGPPCPVWLGLAAAPVDESNPFLFHKTTVRDLYKEAAESRPDCDDVLLWNSQGEITESTRANVVVELDGHLLTPPIACGLLGGTMRAELLAQGQIREAVIRKEDLARASRIWLVNSVRKWMETELRG